MSLRLLFPFLSNVYGFLTTRSYGYFRQFSPTIGPPGPVITNILPDEKKGIKNLIQDKKFVCNT